MSNSTNTIISQLSNLDKEFVLAKKNKDSNKMFKILYYMRVLHGDVLLSINNFKIEGNDIKRRYRLSLLKSLLYPIEDCIKSAENILRNTNMNSKLKDIASYIDASTEEVVEEKKQYVEDDAISLEDILYSESQQISETMPDQPTEEILNNNIKDYNKNLDKYNKQVDKENSKLCDRPFGVKGSDNLLVLFYAPWCGWSKKFLPVWDEFVDKMKDTEGIKCIKVNSDEKPDCIDHFGIKGFPTIKLLRKDDKTVEFKEHRNVESLIKWTKTNMK